MPVDGFDFLGVLPKNAFASSICKKIKCIYDDKGIHKE